MFIWTLGTVIEVIVAVVLLLIIVLTSTSRYIKQARCKHTRFYENRACHAICNECRKDLGFVQLSRDNPDRSET